MTNIDFGKKSKLLWKDVRQKNVTKKMQKDKTSKYIVLVVLVNWRQHNIYRNFTDKNLIQSMLSFFIQPA